MVEGELKLGRRIEGPLGAVVNGRNLSVECERSLYDGLRF